MAQQEIAVDLFTNSFRQLQLEMRTQGLVNQIRPATGESYRIFRGWLKDMDRCGAAVQFDDEKMKNLALQTLKGAAAEFCARQCRQNPQITWPQLLDLMRARFSDLADQQFAKQKLKKIRQSDGETVQTFAERVQELSEDVYTHAELQNPLVQRELRDVFIDGIKTDAIARRLIKERPQTLDAAINIASTEQTANRTFDLRRPHRHEEPMEIDITERESNPNITRARANLRTITPQTTSQPPAPEIRTNDLEHRVNLLQSQLERAVNEISKTQSTMNDGMRDQRQRPQYRRPDDRYRRTNNQYRWTNDGSPICDNCHRPGHVRRQCRALRQGQAGPQSRVPNVTFARRMPGVKGHIGQERVSNQRTTTRQQRLN